MPNNKAVLYGIPMLGGSEKVSQIGGPESLYDPGFLIFPYKVKATFFRTENCQSLAASSLDLFNLQQSASFIQMDSCYFQMFSNATSSSDWLSRI